MVPLKYISNVQKTLEMTLIVCEINLILTCSANCFIVAGVVHSQVPTFAIMFNNGPVVTLSTQDNAKLLQ